MRALATERHARGQIDRLRERLPVPVVELPRLTAARMSGDDLRHLGEAALRPATAGGA